MTYGNLISIRALTGVSSTEVADATVNTLIDMADAQIDTVPNVSLSSSQKTLASNYLTSSFVLRNATGSAGTPNSYSLNALRVDLGSVGTLRTSLAMKFLEMYKDVIASGTDGSGIVRVMAGE